MLTITVLGPESYDKESEEFSYPESCELQLEYSLVALSKWESKWKKAYLSLTNPTTEEALGLIEAMCLTPNPPEGIFQRLSEENIGAVNEYINDPMTATWFTDRPGAPKTTEIITNEVIYYWLFSAGIDKEVEEWHLNHLFTLIRVFGAKTAKPKKMSRSEVAQRNRELNARRKKELGTTG